MGTKAVRFAPIMYKTEGGIVGTVAISQYQRFRIYA